MSELGAGDSHLFAMLYNQPVAHRFGIALQELFEQDDWVNADIAVAWVRRSGTRHIVPSLRQFIARGGTLRVIVGIDIENTSQEGLEDLLSLAGASNVTLFVYHNEAQTTFHPKLYLFRNDTVARLIIGSNNLTEAGLFTNTEASLQVESELSNPVIVETLRALDSWCDTSEGLARQLDAALLADLAREKYVLPETTLRQRRQDLASRPDTGKRIPVVRRTLFDRRPVTAPSPPSSDNLGAKTTGRARIDQADAQQGSGSVLIMRVRKARGTQVQIPIRIFRQRFFQGIEEITSTYDGTKHGIHETRPTRGAGAVNTLKVEIPESRNTADPVMRLQRIDNEVMYTVYDSDSPQGRVIMDSLRHGLTDGSTFLSLPSDPSRSTWCRFI